jgi:hypothetical protein
VKTSFKAFLLPVVALLTVTSALADTVLYNYGPPPGLGAQVFELSGQPLPGGGNGTTFAQYTGTFVATLSSSEITFAFRDDPAFLTFADASVTDLTESGGELLTNGDFSAGSNGWSFANWNGAAYAGSAQSGANCGTYAYCWYDGATQGYDGIWQSIDTIVGHTYQISFWLAESSADPQVSAFDVIPAVFSRVATSGDMSTADSGGGYSANGINVVVYSQLPPPETPEPASFALMLAGAALIGVRKLRLRRR